MWNFIKLLFKFIKELLSLIYHGLNSLSCNLKQWNSEFQERHSYFGSLDEAIKYSAINKIFIKLNKKQIIELMKLKEKGYIYISSNKSEYHWCTNIDNEFYNITYLINNNILFCQETEKYNPLSYYEELDNLLNMIRKI